MRKWRLKYFHYLVLVIAGGVSLLSLKIAVLIHPIAGIIALVVGALFAAIYLIRHYLESRRLDKLFSWDDPGLYLSPFMWRKEDLQKYFQKYSKVGRKSEKH